MRIAGRYNNERPQESHAAGLHSRITEYRHPPQDKPGTLLGSSFAGESWVVKCHPSPTFVRSRQASFRRRVTRCLEVVVPSHRFVTEAEPSVLRRNVEDRWLIIGREPGTQDSGEFHSDTRFLASTCNAAWASPPAPCEKPLKHGVHEGESP